MELSGTKMRRNSCSSSSNNSKNVHVHDVLDLHGFRRDRAIRDLTMFLEKNKNKKAVAARRRSSANDNAAWEPRISKVWVRVITGTGSHSQNGPVIRTAVHQLLEKRTMEYYLEPTKASFLVNACSGFELFSDSTSYTTKVLVLPEKEASDYPSYQRKNNKPVLNRSSEKDDENTSRPLFAGPSPLELAGDDARMEMARQHSLQDMRKQKSEQDKGKAELHQVIQLSSKEENERLLHIQLLEQQFNQALEKALDSSVEEVQKMEALQYEKSQREDEDLLKALAESRREDEELHKALATSKEEEEELQKALAASEQCFHSEQQSRYSSEEEMEQVLQTVMQQSLKTM